MQTKRKYIKKIIPNIKKMSIQKLKRVLWNLAEQNKSYFLKKEIIKVIMLECGTDPKTIKVNLNNLIFLKYIKIKSKRYYINNNIDFM